jgi:CRISPR system Cascade subunit CasD
MQSWGVQSHFIYRDTLPEPSKSGVIGLLCAALGRDRSEDLGDVAALTMGIRADREGLIQRDYHTAGKGGYLKASGQIERKDLIQSYRDYLADAAFLVGLEGDPALLARLHDALQHPKWPLYLGRKAFVPGEPVWLRDGLRMNESPIDALRNFPRLREPRDKLGDRRMRAVLESDDGEIVRPDQPLSFAKDARRFGLRRVTVSFFADRPLLKEYDDVSLTPDTQPA